MFLWLFESVIQIFFTSTSSFLATSEVAQVTWPATVGPQATLYAINEFISPDGFRRSYVLSLPITLSIHLIFLLISASLINSVFPAPAIIANKV